MSARNMIAGVLAIALIGAALVAAIAFRADHRQERAGDAIADLICQAGDDAVQAIGDGAPSGSGSRTGETTSATKGRMKPVIPFECEKGKLRLPAPGRLVMGFGQRTQAGGTSRGVVLEVRPAAVITAPADGWVVFAGEFREFGQLLVVNCGGGYHILLAGLSKIDTQLGVYVLAGEPVARMSSRRSSEDAPPVLYIEFRKDSRPIDPSAWFPELR